MLIMFNNDKQYIKNHHGTECQMEGNCQNNDILYM